MGPAPAQERAPSRGENQRAGVLVLAQTRVAPPRCLQATSVPLGAAQRIELSQYCQAWEAMATCWSRAAALVVARTAIADQSTL